MRSISKKPGTFHHGDLRRALVVAALGLIEERGVRGFTLADASRAAGVSRSAPYKHFRSKEDLLAAAAVEAFARFRRQVCEGLRQPDAGEALFGDRRDVVRRFLHRLADFAFGDTAAFRAMFGAGIDKLNFPELLAVDSDSFRRFLTAVAQAEAEQGRPGDDRAFWLGKHLFLGVYGQLLFALDGHLAMLGGRGAIAKAIDETAVVWLGGKGHAPAGSEPCPDSARPLSGGAEAFAEPDGDGETRPPT